MFRNILVATDNCPAVLWAIRYTGVLFPNAVFHLLSIVDISDKSIPYVEETVRLREEVCMKALETGKNILEDCGVNRIKMSVEKGMPSKEILRYVQENDVELVVISRHSKEGSQEVHLGGTFRRVMEHVHCPVLTVPGEVTLSRPKTIFNPTSGSVYSMSASEMAVLLSDYFNADMYTLYVGPPDRGRVLSTVEALAEKIGVRFQGDAVRGSVEKEVLKRINQFDLTVMSRGYRSIRYKMRWFKRSLALGSLERLILAETGKPIMVVGD